MSITVTHVSKRFNLYARPWHRFKEWMTLGRKQWHTPFWALRDINLQIPGGTAMGIVGPNGAGKSTLLKIITGTLFPTEGRIEVEGRVAGLLELGTGFHPEFTGRTNIYLNGKMLGLSDEEIQERFPEIVRFSELGDFIEQPVRTYSSGMVMRLGFAIASCVDPDILIIDEVLSVGDAYFSQKCIRRIREFREKGVTILFVSHDPTAVLTLCDHAVLLENGTVQRCGAPDEIIDFYNARIADRSAVGGMKILVNQGEVAGAMGTQRSGNFRALIAGIEMRNQSGKPSEVFAAGEKVRLAVRILFLERIANPTIGILIRNHLGVEVYGVNTCGLGQTLGTYEPGETTEAVFDFDMDLGPADYTLTVAVHLDETHLATNFDWIDKAWRFRVLPGGDMRFYGLARLQPVFSISRPRQPLAEISDVIESAFGHPPALLDETAACDRFFLEGWRISLEQGSSRHLRVFKGEGRFVFCPPTPNLRIVPERKAFQGIPEPLPPLHLSWTGGHAAGELLADGAIAFALPPALAGQTRIFTLTAVQGADAHQEKALSTERRLLTPQHSALSTQHLAIRAIQAQPERAS